MPLSDSQSSGDLTFTDSTSGKVKRLRKSSRARVAPCNVSGKLRGEWREAVVHVIEDEKTVKRAYDALRAKYGWQMRLTDLVSTLGGRIGRRAMLEIEI